MKSKIFKNYFFIPKNRFEKKYFSKISGKSKIFFWNFEILIFGSSSGTPIAPYALVDVFWKVFDGFRARVALARLLDTFSADFQSISLQIPFIYRRFGTNLKFPIHGSDHSSASRLTFQPRELNNNEINII